MNLQSKTDEELNVMLAELVGWKTHDHPDCLAKKEGWASRDWKTWVMNPAGELVMFTAIPRYCSSLDEVARVEAGLTDEEKSEYAERYLLFYSGAETREQGPIDFWKLATASARQRTIGLIEVKRSTLTKTP